MLKISLKDLDSILWECTDIMGYLNHEKVMKKIREAEI